MLSLALTLQHLSYPLAKLLVTVGTFFGNIGLQNKYGRHI
jgi:hypothetical protein